MRDVVIIGIGQTPVDEHWDRSLRHMAHDAIMPAMADAAIETADALYVGNMLSGQASGQEHLGALIADFIGLRGIEAMKVEAACASGGAALRAGFMAVSSGLHDVVLVCGVEKMTDAIGTVVTNALATAADQEYEVSQGISFIGLNALLMRRYMYEYGVSHKEFAGFTLNAHRNAVNNPNAMFRKPISEAVYLKAGMIADPINLMDSSPVCDGAACVVLAPADLYKARAKAQILASAVATDSLAVHDRRDPLVLEGAVLSSRRAYAQAHVTPADIRLFELHDAFSIMSALSLEACGFAGRGAGVRMAAEGEIGIGGRIPISTLGGLKARGHPVGATGVYQVIEVVQHLTGQAGANQVPGATIGMAQNIGGSGATVITHILGAI
jgi:acetyl-CoA C-acetyltransferase